MTLDKIDPRYDYAPDVAPSDGLRSTVYDRTHGILFLTSVAEIEMVKEGDYLVTMRAKSIGDLDADVPAPGPVEPPNEEPKPTEPPKEEPKPEEPKPEEPRPEEPAPAEPPKEEPKPEPKPEEPKPAPAPKPPAVPAQPSGGVVGARTVGRDVVTCRLPGVSVSADAVIVSADLPDFSDWHIGTRRLILTGRIARLSDITSIDGQSGSMPLIHALGGGGFDMAEHVTVLGQRGSMIFKQEGSGIAGVIRAWDMRGMTQDAIKVSGGNLIEGSRMADLVYRGGSPHADAVTVMSADGDVTIRDNDIDWYYDNNPATNGTNNWFRIEPYAAGSRIFDDVIIEGNRLIHRYDKSFAIQIAEKNSPTWRGSVKIRNNMMTKAGGAKKILYAPSARISEWAGNTDADGVAIPLSAA